MEELVQSFDTKLREGCALDIFDTDLTRPLHGDRYTCQVSHTQEWLLEHAIEHCLQALFEQCEACGSGEAAGQELGERILALQQTVGKPGKGNTPLPEVATPLSPSVSSPPSSPQASLDFMADTLHDVVQVRPRHCIGS